MMTASNKGIAPDDERETMAKEPLSAKGLAIELGTDARTVRKFLRHKFGGVGQGHRWQIEATKKSLTKIHKEFDAWQKPKDVKKIDVGDDEIPDEIDDMAEAGVIGGDGQPVLSEEQIEDYIKSQNLKVG